MQLRDSAGHITNRWMRVIAATGLLACLAACSTPYSRPEIVGDDPRATGIGTLLRQADVPAVDVLLVHGMCTHDTHWVAEVNNALLEVLGQSTRVQANTLEPTRRFGDTEVYKLDFTIDAKPLATYAIVWSPAMKAQKSALCYDRSDADEAAACAAPSPAPAVTPYPYRRAKLNAELKNKLMDDCLADAVIYVGETRRTVREQVAQAIAWIEGQSRGAALARQQSMPPLTIITESLGSKVLFDTLVAMQAEGRAEAESVFTRSVQIFMAANQIPLLSLAAPAGVELTSEGMQSGDVPIWADPLSRLFSTYSSLRRERLSELGVPVEATARNSIVAFSDPSDLLSFTLVGSKAQPVGYRVADVIVSNAPAYFGYLESPWPAHTTYLSSEPVKRIVVCGIPTDEACAR